MSRRPWLFNTCSSRRFVSLGHAGPLGFACKSGIVLGRPLSPRGASHFSWCPNRFWLPLLERKCSCVLPGSVRFFVRAFAKPHNRQATSRTVGTIGPGGSNKSCGGSNDQISFKSATMLSVGCQAGFTINRVYSFNELSFVGEGGFDEYLYNIFLHI